MLFPKSGLRLDIFDRFNISDLIFDDVFDVFDIFEYIFDDVFDIFECFAPPQKLPEAAQGILLCSEEQEERPLWNTWPTSPQVI